MRLQNFKYGILKQGFQITEIGKYVKVSNEDEIGEFQIHTRLDLRDSDGLNWYRELIIPHDLYGTEEHVESLKDAMNEIFKRYSDRQATNIHTCQHTEIVILGGLYLCIHCKAKIKGKVPINLKNVN